ncbi:kinase-like domain-containing protein [Cladorrhinum samala]|uniref:Kinase-like domain-containing protein n=1 Tax=Cladorrhinum samala TaxID=585594 RepID=A0AAV9HAB9_9PEZI|nr:kinase-like domain-containing protein [Cladorrhinum samala]
MSLPLNEFQKHLDAARISLYLPENMGTRGVAQTETHFFDVELVRSLTSATTVADILHLDANMPRPTTGKVASLVCESFLRVFCVLAVMNRLPFIAYFLSRNASDDRLPVLTAAELASLVPELGADPSAAADGFLRIQWQFLPWILQRDSLHLDLPGNTILPFVRETRIGQGDQGVLSVVEIPQRFQRLRDTSSAGGQENVRVVRKVLKTVGRPQGSGNAPTAERECLELLHMLKHPNIIPLLASYTLGSQHAMLFPEYEMDLEVFLKQPSRFGGFVRDSVFLAAVYNLASALQAVHDFNHRLSSNPTLVARYGYHHDLRPANILVAQDTFILADFGLAQTKHVQEEPSRKFRETVGDYEAPECMDEKFNPLSVGKSYDVWALGCLVAELATYMERGPAGVREFRSARKTPNPYQPKMDEHNFFSRRLLKPEVAQWFDAALSNESQHAITPSLATFCRNVLEPEPSRRPRVQVCVSHLSYLHAKSLFHEAHSLLSKVLETFTAEDLTTAVSPLAVKELRADMARFEAFGAVMDMFDDDKFDPHSFDSRAVGTFVVGQLERSCAQLRLVQEACSDPAHFLARLTLQLKMQGPSIQPASAAQESFRQCLGEMCEALPASTQQMLNSLWRNHSEQADDDGETPKLKPEESKMQRCSASFRALDLPRRIENLDSALSASARRVIDPGMILDWSNITERRNFDRSRSRAVYAPPFASDRDENVPVLIEWVFVTQMNPDESPEQRTEKMLLLASLLKGPHPEGVRLLRCLGFLRPKNPSASGSDSQDTQYGFVFAHPPACVGKVPVTLETLLDVEKSERAPRSMTLGDKFNLAKSLAGALFELHSRNWLHKNMSPNNVLFFRDSDSSGACTSAIAIDIGSTGVDLDHPYLIGFHHSRPEGEFYSDLWSANSNQDLVFYLHPEYPRRQPSLTTRRFEKRYDYHGLGMMLLEIAHWKLCKNLWKEHNSKRDKGLDRSQFQVRLATRFESGLAAIMGRAYRDAVVACLTGGKRGSEDQLEVFDKGFGPGWAGKGEDSWFHREIVERLEKCFVG